ncbi:MAG: bacterial Ig-like domain-containing protein [Roseburia sp.]
MKTKTKRRIAKLLSFLMMLSLIMGAFQGEVNANGAGTKFTFNITDNTGKNNLVQYHFEEEETWTDVPDSGIDIADQSVIYVKVTKADGIIAQVTSESWPDCMGTTETDGQRFDLAQDTSYVMNISFTENTDGEPQEPAQQVVIKFMGDSTFGATRYKINEGEWKSIQADEKISGLVEGDQVYVQAVPNSGKKIDETGTKFIVNSEQGTIDFNALKSDTGWNFTYKTEGNYEVTIEYTNDDTNDVTSISVTTQPTKTSYIYGESFDKTGLKVIATFADGSTKDVTDDVTFEGDIVPSNTTIKAVYTKDGVTVKADITISVSHATIDISALKWTGTTFEYNGTAQGPAFSSTLPTGVALESKTGASNTSVGNYSAVANLKLADGYSQDYYKLVNTSGTEGINVAADGSTATVSQAWSITKAAPTITLSNLSETTKAPTGVKATIRPEDATATVVIEYQVELSTNGQTTKQWVTTRPTVAGTYPVRAYLPEGTKNLEAVAEANAVTGTYILTQYTAPTDNEGKDVNTTDPASNALKANLAEDAKLADKVLTPEEQASGGTVSLTVQDITKTVSDADKTLVESKLGGATLGMYLDFDLTKVVSGRATPVTETIDAVKICLTLPTSLINTDTSKVRTYQMIRVHDFGAGPVAETLPCTFDAATGTVSFETKYFSTYALVYSDAAIPALPSDTPSEDTNVNTAVKDAAPNTGDAGSTVLWYVVVVISGLGAVYFGKEKRNPQNRRYRN